MMGNAEIEIEVLPAVYDGQHSDDGAGVCTRCSRKLPTSYWCDRNQTTHPGGTICIDGIWGRYVDAYEDGGWEYELDRVYWLASGESLDETERDIFFDEIHAAAVETLRGRW